MTWLHRPNFLYLCNKVAGYYGIVMRLNELQFSLDGGEDDSNKIANYCKPNYLKEIKSIHQDIRVKVKKIIKEKKRYKHGQKRKLDEYLKVNI